MTTLESFLAARNEFFHRMVKWFYSDTVPIEVPEPKFKTPDFAMLVCLLQTIGFELHSIDKLPFGTQLESQRSEATFTIDIKSAPLGLHAILKEKSAHDEPSASDSGYVVKQDNSQDKQMVTSYLLPVVSPGVALLTREVVSQLTFLLSGREQIQKQVQCEKKWFSTLVKPQTETSGFQSDRSQKTNFAVEKSDNNTQQQPATDISEDTAVTENMIAAMSGSNEALSQCPTSPLLSGNTPRKPELIRQKTWSIGSINEIDEQMLLPTRTSSPVQQEFNFVEHQTGRGSDLNVTERLHNAVAKLQEVLLILNTSNDNNALEDDEVPPSKAKEKSSIKRGDAHSETSTITKAIPIPNMAAGGSNVSRQLSGTVKRLNLSVAKSPVNGRNVLETPKLPKRRIPMSDRATPSPRMTQGIERKAVGSLTMSNRTTENPKLAIRTISSNTTPAEGNKRSEGVTRTAFSSRNVLSLASTSSPSTRSKFGTIARSATKEPSKSRVTLQFSKSSVYNK